MTVASRPELSVIVPAYNAATTIARTLRSVARPGRDGGAAAAPVTEIIVVDDGSDDRDGLESVVARVPTATIVHHDHNRGMVAARNTGIRASRGDIVTILDADDEFVPDWPAVFRRIVSEWPAHHEVCFAACVDPTGQPTVSAPTYRGPLTFADALNDRRAGEYLPMFRGPYIRERGYADLGMRRSCGSLSYFSMLREQAFWVTPHVLRIYHTDRPGSVSAGWGDPRSAAESARCIRAILDRYGRDYARLAPRQLRRQYLRSAVYARLAGEPGWLGDWLRGFRPSTAAEAMVALLMMGTGPTIARRLVAAARRVGVLKRYG